MSFSAVTAPDRKQPEPAMNLPKIALLRGHSVNVWDLGPLEQLKQSYDFEVLVTESNLHNLSGLNLPTRMVRTPRDFLPGTRVAGTAAYAIGERYLDLEAHLEGSAIVHSAEIASWFTAQAASLRAKLGFRLVATVWETLAHRDVYRWPRERRYRRSVLECVDVFIAATKRARDCLLLEGVPDERIVVSYPGIDLEHFSARTGHEASAKRLLFLSAGRLVWEKGHQDAIRALAAIHTGVVEWQGELPELLIVGDGPERKKLKRYAQSFGLGSAVSFQATVPYTEMPELYRRADCLLLCSLARPDWEEQFGMVLVEAMAAGTPIVASSSGAIPEVCGDETTLVSAGDWRAIAEELSRRALKGNFSRVAYEHERLATFSSTAAARRLDAIYRDLLGRGGSI